MSHPAKMDPGNPKPTSTVVPDFEQPPGLSENVDQEKAVAELRSFMRQYLAASGDERIEIHRKFRNERKHTITFGLSSKPGIAAFLSFQDPISEENGNKFIEEMPAGKVTYNVATVRLIHDILRDPVDGQGNQASCYKIIALGRSSGLLGISIFMDACHCDLHRFHSHDDAKDIVKQKLHGTELRLEILNEIERLSDDESATSRRNELVGMNEILEKMEVLAIRRKMHRDAQLAEADEASRALDDAIAKLGLKTKGSPTE